MAGPRSSTLCAHEDCPWLGLWLLALGLGSLLKLPCAPPLLEGDLALGDVQHDLVPLLPLEPLDYRPREGDPQAVSGLPEEDSEDYWH